MSTIRKSISFTDTLSDWMQRLVESGEYANESEYVRDLVRRDRDKNAKFMALKSAIDEGLNSGVSNKTVSEIIEQRKAKLQDDGLL